MKLDGAIVKSVKLNQFQGLKDSYFIFKHSPLIFIDSAKLGLGHPRQIICFHLSLPRQRQHLRQRGAQAHVLNVLRQQKNQQHNCV